MGSNAKTGNFFLLEGHRSTSLHQKHKSAIWNRTLPHLHTKPSLYVCRRVQGSQIFKQNWIILIRSRVIVILLIWVSSAQGVGQVGGGCLGWSAIVYMSSGMFRGKESSNRIELSRLVQDLLNFGVLGSLRLWGLGGWVYGGGGWLGGAPHTCAHARTHAHGKHDNFMQMAAPIGGIPGNSLWCHTRVRVCAHACVCVHVRPCACMCVHVHECACVWGAPSHHPPLTSTHPPTPQGGTPGINKNSIALELIEIFQFRLKIWNLWRLPHPWVGVWFGGWVDGWGQVKTLKI